MTAPIDVNFGSVSQALDDIQACLTSITSSKEDMTAILNSGLWSTFGGEGAVAAAQWFRTEYEAHADNTHALLADLHRRLVDSLGNYQSTSTAIRNMYL